MKYQARPIIEKNSSLNFIYRKIFYRFYQLEKRIKIEKIEKNEIVYFPKSIRSWRIVLQSLTATSNFYRQNSRIRFGKQAEFSRPANSTDSRFVEAHRYAILVLARWNVFERSERFSDGYPKDREPWAFEGKQPNRTTILSRNFWKRRSYRLGVFVARPGCQAWRTWIPRWKSQKLFTERQRTHLDMYVTCCFSFFFPTIAGVTILLSLTVFLNLVAESMPTTSDAVPLIGTYAYHHDSYASVCLTVSVISMFPCKYVHVHRNCACRIEPFLFRK